MKVLITGNMGYVGSVLVAEIKKYDSSFKTIGFDTGFFAHSIFSSKMLPELSLDKQYFGDIRKINSEVVSGVDVVIHLCAISNDPMGNEFACQTKNTNLIYSKKFAILCKEAGVKKFVFASSCSVYGFASDAPRSEFDELNPLTSYSESKVEMEKSLKELSDKNFQCIALRFATACGASPRLRLDLVLNDFVFSAAINKNINIKSNGTPWRPLIDVYDMARAFLWGIEYTNIDENYICVNVGSNEWNYRVIELAKKVIEHYPNASLKVNESASDDKRSYKVNFDLYNSLAPGFRPQISLDQSIKRLKKNISEAFRPEMSDYVRLDELKRHIIHGRLNKDLFWQY